MAYEVKVSTADVAAKAATVSREAHEIEARLAQLTSQMAELSHTWTGAASTSFQGLFHDWDTTARQMRAALEGIGRSLRGAGQEYDALEHKLASQFA